MDSKVNGISVIKDAYHLHLDDPEAVEDICMLINEMAQYGEMVVVFVESLSLLHPQKIVKKTVTAAAQGCVSSLGKDLQERMMIWNSEFIPLVLKMP